MSESHTALPPYSAYTMLTIRGNRMVPHSFVSVSLSHTHTHNTCLRVAIRSLCGDLFQPPVRAAETERV